MALTADVVIIGGGVTGTSTAFHLTRRGVRDVIVVDKSFVASGGTGKSSACVRQHYSTPETCRMIRYALDCFQRFEEVTGGHSCGFRRTESRDPDEVARILDEESQGKASVGSAAISEHRSFPKRPSS